MRICNVEISVDGNSYLAGTIMISEEIFSDDTRLLYFLCDAQYLADTSLLHIKRGAGYFTVYEEGGEEALEEFSEIAMY